MTVRGLLLALALLASAPTEAASCHRYAIWHYPWRQSCGVVHAVRVSLGRQKAAIELPTDFDIPLPFLSIDDYGAGQADEVTAARLMLLGYAYGR